MKRVLVAAMHHESNSFNPIVTGEKDFQVIRGAEVFNRFRPNDPVSGVIKPLMEGGATPWMLYLAGAALALILTMIGVPALAFALGMFIPLELNVPLVVGGAVNWYVTSRSKDAALNAERGEKGTLLASGFIAGALMGGVSAAMRFGGVNLVNDAWLNNTWSEVLALGAYAILIFYLVKASMKTK